MSGQLAPMRKLNEVAERHNAVLYVDDAHGTGVLGRRGRGTVLDALGDYDNTFVVGSLSKAFSCSGGVIGCTAEVQPLLKMRPHPYNFRRPVAPAYPASGCPGCARPFARPRRPLLAPA